MQKYDSPQNKIEDKDITALRMSIIIENLQYYRQGSERSYIFATVCIIICYIRDVDHVPTLTHSLLILIFIYCLEYWTVSPFSKGAQALEKALEQISDEDIVIKHTRECFFWRDYTFLLCMGLLFWMAMYLTS